MMEELRDKELDFLYDQVFYWKKRCELAEEYIAKSPSDHDITTKQKEAYKKWQELKNKGEPRAEIDK